MKTPEFRVRIKGPMTESVLWDPCNGGEPPLDLTGMKIIRLTRVVEPGELPVVQVSFVARLVEIEEEAE